MTSSYLVCELCGNHGPPAGFFFKDGMRLCYACYFEDMTLGGKPNDLNPEPDKTHDDATRRPDRKR
jgi:hypothetical protein